jgi:acetone carboxylase gamma subunit
MVLLEKLTSIQLVKNYPAFYGTRKFITAFTSFRHLPLSWASSIRSISPHSTFWISSLILSSHLRLGLPSGLFSLRFPHQNPVYDILQRSQAWYSYWTHDFSIVRDVFTDGILFIEDFWDIELMKLNKRARIYVSLLHNKIHWKDINEVLKIKDNVIIVGTACVRWVYITSKHTFYTQYWFFRKSCRLWDNAEKYGTAGQATDDNVIRRMRFACWTCRRTHS